MGAFLCLSIIVLVILSPWVQVFSFGDPYVLSLLALAAHLLFLNASNLLRIFVNRMRMCKVPLWNSIISASATLVITIPLGLLGWGSWGFIIAGIAGNAVCCAQMLARINPFLRICWADFKQVFVTYKKFTFFPAAVEHGRDAGPANAQPDSRSNIWQRDRARQLFHVEQDSRHSLAPNRLSCQSSLFSYCCRSS